jgi:hypothetical protein
MHKFFMTWKIVCRTLMQLWCKYYRSFKNYINSSDFRRFLKCNLYFC